MVSGGCDHGERLEEESDDDECVACCLIHNSGLAVFQPKRHTSMEMNDGKKTGRVFSSRAFGEA